MKVLIVDDEKSITNLLKEYNEHEGNEVYVAYDGLEAIKAVRDQSFDIILMDVMMPKMDGMQAAESIREFSDVPILMLSAKGEEYDKLKGFSVGIDDYVVKPFSPKEVLARQNAIVQRFQSRQNKVLTFGGLAIDFAGRTVSVFGEKVSMTNKEYEVLFYLVRNRSMAISRDKLLADVWDFAYEGDARTVDTHIKMLRESLGECKTCIQTVRGVGYKFEYEKD